MNYFEIGDVKLQNVIFYKKINFTCYKPWYNFIVIEPMGNKIYHLGNCSTCQTILKSLDTSSCELQDIKHESISEKQLDAMAKLAGSYEALFSRKAIKYRTLGLKDKKLTEKDYRKLILEEYTFLKRPVIIVGKEIFVGSIKANVENARMKLKK